MKRRLIEHANRALTHLDDTWDAVWHATNSWLAEQWWDTLEDWEQDELTDGRGN